MTKKSILIFSNLKKASKVFDRFRKRLNDDQDKYGAVQAFEFCYELAWKAMAKVLDSENNPGFSPKDTVRKAVKLNLISNFEIWLHFHELRNLTVHTYNEDNLEEIIESFDDFSRELNLLILNLEQYETVTT